MAGPTRIWTDIDYEREGKQVGYLHLHHSVTRSAYGDIMIPIAVIRNGEGPTAFLMSGNHGDEYEGQIVLCKMIRSLEAKDIKGRVIILPAANMPAALDGARVSPIDQGNLNRAFPGDPDGGPTRQMAYYIDSVLFPLADVFHDLHSGGSSLDYVPFVSIHESYDASINERGMAALKIFGAEHAIVWTGTKDLRYSTNASMHRGVVTLGSEFGGGGSVSVSALKMVERGMNNLLRHMGILPGKPEPTSTRTRLMSVGGKEDFVYAPEPGLFEPFTELGDNVTAGQPCGQVHFVDNPARAPVPCHFKNAGMVICKRHFGRVERGDCVAHLAHDFRG
ncbi:MAG: deacylase [Alphaproteobacteria bacterium]|nr:deacylase [Alphaproteobacteria bacterium]